MPKLKLTKKAIDAIKPSESEEFYWDSEMQGFGLVVYPSGIKSFILQYRNKLNRGRRKVLGRYGIETVDGARTIARQHWSDISKGGDPVDEERALRNSMTMSQLFDRHIEDHMKIHNSASTVISTIPQINNYLRPAFGMLKVHSVTRQDIQKLHLSLKDKPRAANKLVAILSKVFSNAELWGVRDENSNPCRKVRKYEENHRERFLSPVELGRLGDALKEAETVGLPWLIVVDGENTKHLAKPGNQRSPVAPEVLKIIRLLLYTGARRGEIIGIQWEHVDFEHGLVMLPKIKGGQKKPHPLSAVALEILASIRRVDGSPWVFPRPTDKERHISPEVVENAWQRLRKRAEIEDVRLHDLRHTVGTYAGQSGANAFIVRDLLRHASTAMTNNYVNFDADPVRILSTSIGKRISEGLAGGNTAEIVQIKQKIP